MSSSRSSSPLPAIAEDGTNDLEPRDPPPIPPRALNRPPPRQLIFGAPPRHNYEGSPPPYSGFDPVGVEGPKGEKLADIRKNVTENVKNNKFVARRGGWKRLAIAAAILTCITVGLVVGLLVGLYHGHSSKYGSLVEIVAFKANYNTAQMSAQAIQQGVQQEVHRGQSLAQKTQLRIQPSPQAHIDSIPSLKQYLQTAPRILPHGCAIHTRLIRNHPHNLPQLSTGSSPLPLTPAT